MPRRAAADYGVVEAAACELVRWKSAMRVLSPQVPAEPAPAN
jgi:hypothetical protein